MKLIKAILLGLFILLGLTDVDAQVIKRDLAAPQNYESATKSDWVYTGKQTLKRNKRKPLYTSELRTVNNNKYVNNILQGSSNDQYTPGSLVKNIDYIQDPGTGYTDETLTKTGYVVEFDFQLFSSMNILEELSDSRVQLVVGTGAVPTADTYYNGSNYVFALSQERVYDENNILKWHVNDLDNKGEESITIEKGTWYHLKLIISANSCDYYLTTDNGETDAGQGSLQLKELPKVTYFWNLISGDGTNTSYFFDNFEIYDYVPDNNTPTVPTITLKKDNITSKEYTITCKDDETLYYELPGQTEYTKVDGTSADVTATQSGPLLAYTMKEVTKSAIVTANVKIPPLTYEINNVTDLASFSSAYPVKVPDDVYIYVAKVNGNGSSVTLNKIKGSKIVPAKTGVFLYKEGGGNIDLDYFDVSGLNQELYKDNDLIGTDSSTYTVQNDNSIYALAKGVREIDAVMKGIVIGSYKAYFNFSNNAGAKLDVVFNDDTATGINSVNKELSGKNNSNAIYNLNGQRVNDTFKGIIIRKGKKYINR